MSLCANGQWFLPGARDDIVDQQNRKASDPCMPARDLPVKCLLRVRHHAALVPW
jgi:hypothetical protein